MHKRENFFLLSTIMLQGQEQVCVLCLKWQIVWVGAVHLKNVSINDSFTDLSLLLVPQHCSPTECTEPIICSYIVRTDEVSVESHTGVNNRLKSRKTNKNAKCINTDTLYMCVYIHILAHT